MKKRKTRYCKYQLEVWEDTSPCTAQSIYIRHYLVPIKPPYLRLHRQRIGDTYFTQGFQEVY